MTMDIGEGGDWLSDLFANTVLNFEDDSVSFISLKFHCGYIRCLVCRNSRNIQSATDVT